MEDRTPAGDNFCRSSWILKRFNINRVTLSRWMARSSRPFPLPAVRPGRNRYWRVSDVLTWEAEQAVRDAA